MNIHIFNPDAPSDSTDPSKGSTATGGLYKVLGSKALPMSHVLKHAVIFAHLDSGSLDARPFVERLVASLSVRKRGLLHSGLLKFYAAIGDYQSATKYLPARGREWLSELLPSMLVHLHFSDLSTAKRLYMRCKGEYLPGLSDEQKKKSDYMLYGLYYAVGLYEARRGNRSNALDYWADVTAEDPLFAQTKERVVLARLADALVAAQDALATVIAKQNASGPAVDGVDQQDPAGLNLDVAERLRHIEQELRKLLPPNEQRLFGIEPKPLLEIVSGEEGQ